VIEYAGPAIEQRSMEGRLTICNMSIEAGARAGMIAPDETTFAYLEGRPGAPTGAAWEQALERWRTLPSDADAVFDRELTIDVSELGSQVTWGTNPGMVVPIDGVVPDPASFDDADARAAAERALTYMALEPGTPIRRHRGRPRVHRLVHEFAHQRSARRSGRGRASVLPTRYTRAPDELRSSSRRRKIARTLLTSSAIENGLVT